MEVDAFVILCKLIVVFIYGSIFIISIIFTFFIDAYHRLEELLRLEFLSVRIVNPLVRNSNFVNDWLVAHNKIIGPMLILVSLWDIFSIFRFINLLL